MRNLISLVNVSKSYVMRHLLENVNLLIEEKSKIGVIGRNGAGKTTLIKIIMDVEEPDSGDVIIYEDTKIGYLKQSDDFDLNENILDYLVRSTNAPEWKCAKTAYKFGLDSNRIKLNIGSLSSGFRMRLKLTEMMLNEPNFLLLDEPSNFLDLNTLIDLENFLLEYNGGFMIISHDREFLKSICEKTIEVELGKVTYFPGDVEDYFEYKENLEEQVKRHNKNIEDKRANLQRFVDRFRAGTKATQAQSKMKQMEKLKHIEITHPSKNVKIRLPEAPEKNGFALIIDDLVVGYGKKQVAKTGRIELPRMSHTAILGENGEGKTTFLKTIAGELKNLSGEFRYAQGIKIAYFAEHLYQDMTSNENVIGYLKRHAKEGLLTRELQTLLGSFLFSGDDIYKSVSVLSGGEKSRLTLLAAITQCADVLILDEPTNHLDFETVEALAFALKNYKGTILFTSHDRTFASLLADNIIEVKSGTITMFQGNYDSYVYSLRVKAFENSENENNDSSNASYGMIKEIKNNTESKENKNTVSDYEERKKIKNRISKSASEIKKLERELKDLDREKSELNKFFEIAENYDEEKTIRFGNIKNIIAENENNILLLHEEIDKLEKLLS